MTFDFRQFCPLRQNRDVLAEVILADGHLTRCDNTASKAAGHLSGVHFVASPALLCAQ